MAGVHAGMSPNHTLTSHGRFEEVTSMATGEALESYMAFAPWPGSVHALHVNWWPDTQIPTLTPFSRRDNRAALLILPSDG